MSDALTPPIHVLFLCTGNSARSILSEALLNDLGAPTFVAHSAGSKPSGQPHPDALRELAERGHAVDSYSSKSWDAFSDAAAPEIDLVVTVCNAAAGEACPVFRPRAGHSAPMRVHWPAPDPAHIKDDAAREQAFRDVYCLCRARIEALIALSGDALQDREQVEMIGRVP